MIATTKRIIRGLGLQKIAVAGLNAFTRWRPRRICARGGIRYDLDLNEAIDRAIYLGGWEPQTVRFLRQNIGRGAIVVEVGANIGAHTLLLADLVGPSGRIIAFEPTDYAQKKLRANLALNPTLLDRVIVRSDLVTNHDLATPIRQIRSSFPASGTGRPDEDVAARAIALDDETFANVNFLKIDVDGYDYKVLQGATRLMERFRPVVLVELCEYTLSAQGDSVRDILELMGKLGYRASHEDGRPITGADEVLRLVGSNTSLNAVFR